VFAWFRFALSFGLAFVIASSSGTSFAQSAPVTTPAPAAPLTTEQRIEQLQLELQAQRKASEAERVELEARLQKVEAQAQAAEQKAQAAEAQAAEAAAQGELAALTGGEDSAELAAEPAFSVYGFADVGLQRSWGPIASLVPGGTTKTTFVLGNVNLYFDAKPIPDWRFLSEVRFGLFPHGATDRSNAAAAPLINNTVSDDSAASGGFTTFTWNGVILERAHIDYEPLDELNIRAGLFLTPFGIYNVDHGSPTRIMIEAPLMIISDLMPQRQVGVEAFGRFQALPWTLGYHAYVSNGRQPGHLDYEDDKAIGGRLWAQTRHPVPMTFGLSGYTGHYEQVEKVIGLGAGGNLDIDERESIAYREWSGAADASMDIGELRLRLEGIVRAREFEDGKRTAFVPGSPDADMTLFGGYLLAAYRLPWLGLEPVLQFDLVRYNVPLGEYLARSTIGLNIYFDPAVVLRLNYFHSRFFDLQGTERELKYDYFNSAAARMSIAF
jgi:hypothetical protein